MIRAILLILLATPAAAQDTAQDSATFSLPQGCTAYVTVQMRSCTLSHHFTCAGDPEGYQRRVDLNENGLTYVGSIDAEAQWIESFHALSGHTERLGPNNVDPASLSGLIASGLDTYDFDTVSPEIGTQRFVGQDRLTGQTMTIDGVTLEQTEYRVTAYAADGSEEWTSSGNEFINRDWRVFLSGVSHITTPTDSFDDDDTPMTFDFPGDPGFLSSQPKFGCGAILSKRAK